MSTQLHLEHDRTIHYSSNLKKAILAAIGIHIILLYGVVSPRVPSRNFVTPTPHAWIEIHELPSTPPPTPQKTPTKRTTGTRSAPQTQPLPQIPAIVPLPVPLEHTADISDLSEYTLDTHEWDIPEIDPPVNRPYAYSDPSIIRPQCIHRVLPTFPPPVAKLGLRGLVVVNVLINSEGVPEKARVIESFNSLCDRAALDAVLQWRFTPATLNDVPVPVEMVLTVSFETH